MRRHVMVAVIGAFLASLTFATGAAAADSAQARAKDDAICTRCHDESENKPILAIYQTRHGVAGDPRTPSCQSCHGQSEDHVRNARGTSPRPTPDIVFGAKHASAPDAQNDSCLACHKSDPVLAKVTQPDVCYACHQTQRAQTHRISTHPILAGKMACSDCHNPHGSTGPKLLVKNNVNETCYTCHAEKRGPFLWEHGPVVDDCTNCHTPHGSTNAPLLKARVPWLCQECHSGDHGAAINSGANLPGGAATTVNGLQPLANQSPRTQLNARACTNCHSLVHGSNHPAGAKFQR